MHKQAFILLFVTLVTVTPDAFAQSPRQGFQQQTSAANREQPVLLDSGSQTGQKLVVQWQNEQLTVTAHHATLESVLAAIAKQTGLVVEAGAGPDLDVVYVDLGPGTMHDVLWALVDGNPNNYILIGSARRPGFVERLVLLNTDRGRAAATVATNAPPAPPPQPQLYGGGFAVEPEPASNEAGPTAEVHETDETVVSAAPPPVQSTIDATIKSYQQTYNEMLKSGKSRADILNELQQQQIRDLDAQAAAQPPQQQ